MSRRRRTSLLSVLAAASLVTAACSGGDDDDAASADTGGVTTPMADIQPATPGTARQTTDPDGTVAQGSAPVITEPDPTDVGTESPAGAAGVGTVGGSGCGIPHGPYEDPGEASGEVRVAGNEPPLSFNAQAARTRSVANDTVTYLMGLGEGGGFSYYDADLRQINNDQFGTCTVDSLDPLRVTYAINEGVTWSDGVQIDAADILLSWAAQSAALNDTGPVIAPDGTTANADAEGNPIIVDATGAVVSADVAVDPGTDELLEGYSYQPSESVLFDAAEEGLMLVTQVPAVSEDGLAATLDWSTFFVDYQTSPPAIGVPAHVVGRLAFGLDDPADAKAAVVEAIRTNDRVALRAIAEVWNTGFDATAQPADAGLHLSAGPYVLTAYDDPGQLTFDVNPEYDFGPRPEVATLVYRVIDDPMAAVEAMEDGEIDVMLAEATPDILARLQGLEDRGVVLDPGDGGTYEHVDLVVANGGPFDPATYGGDDARALAVRQAFLKTIPRQEIVDQLIVPLNPDATRRDSFTAMPGEPSYGAITEANGSAAYAGVDLAGSAALLEEAGATLPIDVRFLYAAGNARRGAEYELIRDSAAQVGFNVIDGASPSWAADKQNPSLYDASLFGWPTTTVAVGDSASKFVTDGPNNPQGYSNPGVDAAFAELRGTVLEPAQQTELLAEIESALWSDAFGVTLFQFPEILAYDGRSVTNVSSIPLPPQVFHEVWAWSPVS